MEKGRNFVHRNKEIHKRERERHLPCSDSGMGQPSHSTQGPLGHIDTMAYFWAQRDLTFEVWYNLIGIGADRFGPMQFRVRLFGKKLLSSRTENKLIYKKNS